MSRGSLRVYLGAAPGVGKTYAMLNEGWRRTERGSADVVVGYVETHGREQTAAQIRNLEVVPRRQMEYRGQTFEEMDLERIVARHPELVLVDELAHTNVPGSTHAKRWEDVEALLAAGISVISTVNIQHLESLNDVVERITGVPQRETVPDAMVRAADQIELVDMSPEALRRRMAHGAIYAPQKVDAALGNYFRPGNLAALRELALLWVADRVDEELLGYRYRHGIAGAWETKERVVVALTGAPGADHLVRRAARIAMRTKADLVGVHVQAGDGLAGARSVDLAAHRQLLVTLGGHYHEVTGADIAKALVQFARAENATQIVLGTSRRSRWGELTRGSVVNRLLREAGDSIDVHVISSSDAPGQGGSLLSPPRMRLAALPGRRQAIGLALAVGGVPLLTTALASVRERVGLQNALLCYLLLVVAVATIGGAWPAIIASVAGFMCLNWFFAPPLHTFTITNGRDLLALLVFLVVAGVISALVDLATRGRRDAYHARTEAQALAGMASRLLTDDDPVPALVDDLVAGFSLDGAALLVPTKQGWVAEASAGLRPPASPAEGSLVLDLPEDAQLVLRGPNLRAEDARVLNAFVTQLAVALEGRRLHEQAANAATLARANELRSALLAAVSHDLRTPLASIKAAATSMLSDDVAFEPAATKALLETIDEESDRLNGLVGDLLDMSRLQSGALVTMLRPVGLEEVVAPALSGLPPGAAVEVDVPDTLPKVNADPGLLERALANVVENALTFAPAETAVRIEAGAVAGRVDLRVVDRGRGIPVADRERVFLPFQRLGDHPNGAGVGLGLAVAKGFVEAMGGELAVEDTPGGGCTMVLSLLTAP
jgi:two-component system sensor histidine kinase KdpD